MLLTLYTNERLEFCYQTSQAGTICHLDYSANILVVSRRLFGQSAHRWTTNQDTLTGLYLFDLVTVPLPASLATAHAAPCPVTS